MVVIRNFIGKIGKLGLQRGPLINKKALAHISQFLRIFSRAMLKYALACFKTQIQPIKGAVTLLQHIHHPQGLQIMFKAAILLHAIVQRVLPRMAKWRMAQIMGEGNRFDQIFVQLQIAGDRARRSAPLRGYASGACETGRLRD